MPNYSLVLTRGVFTLTGRPVGRRIARRLRLEAGAFALAGQSVDLNHENADAIGYPAVLDVHGGFGASRTSHSFTTVAGALLLVCAGARRDGSAAPGPITITDNLVAHLPWQTWTDDVAAGAYPGMRGAIFRAVAPGGPMTVTIASVDAAKMGLHVIQIPKAKHGTANSGRATNPRGDPQVLLDEPPLATSIVLGFGVFAGQVPVDKPLAVETAESRHNNDLILETAYTRLAPPQGISWDTTNRISVGLAVEIQAAVRKLEPGEFALTGQDVRLRYSRRLPLEVGAFILASQDIALRKGKSMALAPGSLALAGREVAMRRTYAMKLQPGRFALTGQDLGLHRGRRMALGAGAFDLDGQDVALRAGRRMTVERGQLSAALEVVDMTVS